MTFMQRISLFLAKKYLKTQHLRVRGYADDVIFATGDGLMSPNAFRFFRAVGEANSFEWDLEVVNVHGSQFKGTIPPKKLKKSVLAHNA